MRKGRGLAGAVKRAVFPEPAVSAWKKACREAERVPRFARGRIRLLDFDLEYVDLLTLCPQWHDIFVRETLRTSLDGSEPRILDCGANVGLASLYFRSRYPRSRVTCFEADPEIAEVLKSNLVRNGCPDVDVVRAAVWSRAGSVEFRCEGSDSGAVASVGGELAGEATSVPSVRLKDYLSRETVDLLKLDIEGAEEVVLDDCVDALDRVRVLIMELHELDANRRRTTAVLDRLTRAGFQWHLDELIPLTWRPPVASEDSPFPGAHLCWAVLVRAWRRVEIEGTKA